MCLLSQRDGEPKAVLPPIFPVIGQNPGADDQAEIPPMGFADSRAAKVTSVFLCSLAGGASELLARLTDLCLKLDLDCRLVDTAGCLSGDTPSALASPHAPPAHAVTPAACPSRRGVCPPSRAPELRLCSDLS